MFASIARPFGMFIITVAVACSTATGAPSAVRIAHAMLVDASGARIGTATSRVTLTPGPKSLLDADGSALVLHAGQDDQLTDPSGNSGGRSATRGRERTPCPA